MGLTAKQFYDSQEWLAIRYEALKASRGCCACCGERPTSTNPLHVDHIKPRSLHPSLSLVLSNLQVLCKRCNLGKSNKDDTDWRWVIRVDETRLVAGFALNDAERAARREMLDRAICGSTKEERRSAQAMLEVIEKYARSAFEDTPSDPNP